LLGAVGYGAGLGISLVSDLPPGPLIVCTMTALGVALFLSFPRRIALAATRAIRPGEP
jgi:ABC-type Mn2+/Zn2+ transport system permease subunit